MEIFRISIQDSKVRAFDGSNLVGETTIEKIENFCSQNNVNMPNIWNEQDSRTIEIVKIFFGK